MYFRMPYMKLYMMDLFIVMKIGFVLRRMFALRRSTYVIAIKFYVSLWYSVFLVNYIKINGIWKE